MIDPTRPEDWSGSSDAVKLGGDALTREASQKLLHELQVHQLELEAQNEELRRTQQQLEASHARYFDLYDNAPVGYFTLSPTGLIEEANLAAAGLLGLARIDLVEHLLTSFILPEDQDVYYHHRNLLIETGERQVCELRIVTSSGGSCWVRLNATLTKGNLCRAVMSDISARKSAEETLRASETRHRVLFEKSHDALMTLAPPEWRFTSGNLTTLAMFGVPDEASFVAHEPGEYSPVSQPDGRSSAEKAASMIQVAMREGSHFYEWDYQRLSGQKFPATVLLTRIEIDGRPLLQATVRDETEVKRLHALVSQSDRLTTMGMLAAGVAHEINNPLAYVLYNVELLTEALPKLAGAVERCSQTVRVALGDQAFGKVIGDDADILAPSALNDTIERAREALAGTQRIRTIARAIGAFSRVETTERSRVDLNYAIECATTMALSDIKFRAKLEVAFGRVPAVWASEGKVSQVFLNLLINASQAIAEGDAEHNFIRVRTWVEGNDAFAEVKDTGRGISKEDLDHIFEPFFTTKPVGVGSGLGLPICRNIITEFGGDIRVESEVGRGTRFLVRLPIQPGVSVAPPALPPDVSCPRGRVLVVDDEPAIRLMMVRMLRSEHEIVTAASGKEARVILEQDRAFDVILCDLMMPDMTGMDLHKWLMTQYAPLARKMVFLTGGAFTPAASEYLARVGNLRLQKPYEAAKLKRLVSQLVAAAKTEG